MKKNGIITLTFALLVAALPVLAVDRLNAGLDTPGTQKTLVLPPTADNAPVISLGSSLDKVSGKKVEGLAIIHYKKSYTHRPNHPGNGGGSSCFSYLAQGAKWKTVEPWVVNPANTEGLTSNFVFNTLTNSIAKWEDAADGVVGNGLGSDILGGGLATTTALVADTSSPDGQNEVYFADVSSPGAIAVTIVWGIFGGPPFQRQLVEWDQIYDDVDFDWSATGEPGKMDYDNIVTHEIGHSDGMNHPDDSCTEESMFRFADFGETKKRDLNTGDIAGINKLY